jgi:predicted nucleic acid-binding protein
MSRTVYDTRFFIEHYYSEDKKILHKIREELKRTKEKYVSAITIHEVYELTLAREGRQTAVLRTSLLEKDVKIVKVDSEIAKCSAELRHNYRISMADSIIAATALHLGATCFSDDPHFQAIREIKTKWI